MRPDGSRCPERAFEPGSAEGQAVAAALDRSGIYRTAGMAGVIVGIDIAEALAGCDPALDRSTLAYLFTQAEAGFIAGKRDKES